MFSGQQAQLSSVNKIVFQKAVHIGDLVRLRSGVSYDSPLPQQLQGSWMQMQKFLRGLVLKIEEQLAD